MMIASNTTPPTTPPPIAAVGTPLVDELRSAVAAAPDVVAITVEDGVRTNDVVDTVGFIVVIVVVVIVVVVYELGWQRHVLQIADDTFKQFPSPASCNAQLAIVNDAALMNGISSVS